MTCFNFVAFTFILASLTAISSARKLTFLNKYTEVHRRLTEYVAQYHPRDSVTYDPQRFEQKLDHFDPANTETWQQRYAETTHFYKDNEVVFLFIEGENPMDTLWLTFSAMADYAKTYGAAEFVVEHRFYGESKPKPDLSVESLRYLSSEQALADLAYFITKMNKKYGFKHPKWVVFGGSYAGNLAAWLRYKYPHLVYAAVSSSAPLEAKVDFSEYFETVTKSLATVNPDCPAAIKATHSEMSKAVTSSVGRGELREIFKLCEPLEDDEMEISSFFEGLADIFAGAVEYNENMEYLCRVMTDSKIKSLMKRYAFAYKMIESRYTDDCYDHRYNTTLEYFSDTIPQENTIIRQWYYQTCTEFGYYQTSSNEDDTFGDRLTAEYFIDACTRVYGPRFNEAFLNRSIEETNINYGGRSITADRVVYVHGSLDPWSALGITSNPPQGCYVIVINGSAHCEDVQQERPFDPPQVVQARSKISEIIGNWLNGITRWTEERSVFHF